MILGLSAIQDDIAPTAGAGGVHCSVEPRLASFGSDVPPISVRWMGCKHQVDISNIRYMILNHSLNVLLLFQGSNVALCELGTFKFRFRTTNTHIPEAMKGTVYKWEIYSRKLIGKKPEKGFIIQCRNFRDSRGAPSFRWSMWVVSLNFFRVVFFPFYISSRILIDSNPWMCQNFDFEAIQKQNLSKGITAKNQPLTFALPPF